MRFARLDLRRQLLAQDRWLAPDAAVPELDAALFAQRARRLEAARIDGGFDALVLYADREHGANVAWLTGITPRFEEALCVVVGGRRPTLLLGNENLPYARDAVRIDADFVLHQAFSLPDQDRTQLRELATVLRGCGLARGMRVGAIGWKPGVDVDLPHYIATAIAEASGALPPNAAALLMDPARGLRATLEAPMVRFVEYAARLTSQAILTLIANLRPGMPEREAAGYLNPYGLELSCHPMVNFARAIPSGLGSPRNRPLERGGYAQLAFGVIGSLTCRAGRVVGRADPDADDYLDLVANYLEFVRHWYGALRVGATGGAVWHAAEAARNDAWQPALNPGHLLHIEEWLASPFSAASETPLRSGMAIQQDIIPVPRHGPAVINMEDGLVLADGDLQQQLERLDPALLPRCRARRAQMQALGYALSDDVLPLSDCAGAMMPFLLEPDLLAQVGGA